MTGFDEAHDHIDQAERVELTDAMLDDYPQGSVASPTRTRL